MALYRLGVRLVSFDRPGYGGSDRLVSRRVVDAAPDAAAIADHLGIDRFAVLGRSGGGPHALACAALLPERVTRAGALVSLAPPTAEGLDRSAGIADSSLRAYMMAQFGPEAVTNALAEAASQVRATSHIDGPDTCTAETKWRATHESILATLAASFPEALRGSADGWSDDALAFCSPWGFSLSDIKVPVLLWHGGEDVFTPVAHTRWLASQIGGAVISIQPGTAHFSALEGVPDVLSWLTTEEPD